MKNSNKAHKLLGLMTLEEKASLMSGANFWNTQSIKRLDIGGFMLTDGPHGLRKQGGKADHLGLHKSLEATCFPTAATLANSWDKDLLKEVGEALGKEASVADVSVLLGPGMNIKRNPLNGRNFEYFSEDPYLTGYLAASMIQGIQSQGGFACAKHFAVNSQEMHRMSVDEIVDERALHEIYLEGFRIAVQEGKVRSLMTAYNKVNGVYANESKKLLDDILKKDWGFEGLIVTDWGGNNDRVQALKAGNHLEMPSTNGMTDQDIFLAIKEGSLDEAILDEKVLEFLGFIEELEESKQALTFDYEDHHQLAIDAAKRSIVLLKNKDKVLPLKSIERLLLVGDFMETPRYQGAGSSLINPTKLDSLLSSFENSEFSVSYQKGYHRFGKTSNRLIKNVLELVKSHDKVILFMGLDESSESEGVDRSDMKLPQNQLDLLDAIHEIGKPVVVVLAGGSAVELPFVDKVDGILHGYLPGQGGGSALFDILSGASNPSGKLSESYPIIYEDVPSSAYYPGLEATSEHRESIFIGYRYFDKENIKVRFPFGFGLSYTSFEYSNLELDGLNLSFQITNTGSLAGEEIAQVYLGKKDSQIARAVQELVAFEKVKLEAGETKVIRITLTNHDFEFFNPELNDWDTEAGTYEVCVGSSSRDLHLFESITRDGSNFKDKETSLKTYLNKDLGKLTSSDFQLILEDTLPSQYWDKEKDLDLNDMIKQSQYKSGFGKFINGSIMNSHHVLKKLGKPNAANNVIFAQNLPYRGLARMSGGKVNMDMLDGILLMSNGHFFKGLKHTLKSHFNKRKQ